jgi:hypothetical protein
MVQENLTTNLQVPRNRLLLQGLQWLKYPGLLVAILGCIPTLIELYLSIKTGVPLGQASEAARQRKLWLANQDCLVSVEPIEIPTDRSIKVTALVCPSSGDVLITKFIRTSVPTPEIVETPDSLEPISRWVENDIFQESAFIDLFFPVAIAASINNDQEENQISQSPIVLCTKDLGGGKLLRQVQYPDGQCFNEVIDTYTGSVVSRTQGSCDGNCQ